MAITLVVGQTAKTTGTGTSLSPSLPSNPTAGNLLVIMAIGASGISSISSTGDTWVKAVSTNHSSVIFADIWYATHIAGGSGDKTPVITFNSNPGNAGQLAWLQEYTGGGVSLGLDATTSSSTTLTPGSLTPAIAGELFVAAGGNGETSTEPTSPGGSWTDLGQQTVGASSAANSGDAIYLVNSGSTAENPTFGTAGINPVSVMAAFKLLPGPPNQPTIVLQSTNRASTF